MLQRIQTLYLLIVTVLMILMLTLPLGRFLGGDQEFLLKAFGIYPVGGEGTELIGLPPYMGILIIMATVLPFLTVFFFKNRILQIRLCFMEMVFLLGVQIFVVFYLYHATKSFNALASHSISYSVVDIIPVVSLIFMWLAFRGIAKDEALVRSLDRIR